MFAPRFPLVARRNRFRRTETRPLAFPRSIASRKLCTLRRRSMVRVLTSKIEAISWSVHCMAQSFSSSSRSISDLGRGIPHLRRALTGDLIEGAAVAFKNGFLPAQRLPAFHGYVDVLGIELDRAAHPPGQFRGRKC